MLLFVLALIPVIGLLVFVYLKDRKEKEPFGLLVALFFAGMATVITALIGEWIGEAALGLVFEEKTAAFQIISAIFVVGFSEEIGKFLVLWLITWKNKHFDYSYDAIVYSIFVSLGFACFENVAYVFTNGVGTAIARMLTAVPGHACFAVFMGFFYSKAKYASLTNNKGKSAMFKALAIVVPIAIHGIYDAILMGAQASGETGVMLVSIVVWIIFLIALFVVSVILVIKSARNDFCIVTLPDEPQTQTVYRPAVMGTWTCTCGNSNQLNFCPKCGRSRPTIDNTWVCPKCGTISAYYFCGRCGTPRTTPVQQ